jgi:glucan phosphoethanolaminetransferase (alkaline phosphatase superfamily)
MGFFEDLELAIRTAISYISNVFFVIIFILVFGLLLYFFAIFDSAQSQASKVVQPTNDIAKTVSADIHNAYTDFVQYTNYWMYALGTGMVVAVIFIIASSIREEEGE